jgi:hypothetical protein
MHGLPRHDRINGINSATCSWIAASLSAKLSTPFDRSPSAVILFLTSSFCIRCSPDLLLAASLRARHHAKSRHPRCRLLVRAGRADRLGASGAAVVLLPVRGLRVGHPGEAGSVASTKVSTARYPILRYVVSWSWSFRGDHLPTCAYG